LITQNKLKLFKIEAILKFRENAVYVDRKITVGGITFESLDERKLKISFNIEANSQSEAEIYGKCLVEAIIGLICLKTSICAIINDFNVKVCEEQPKLERIAKLTHITATDSLKVTDRVIIEICLSEQSLNTVIDMLKALEKVDTQKRDYYLRMLYWYNKALLEHDDINRFMLLWTALEVWKTYKLGPSKGKHKKKIKEILEQYGYAEDTDNIYDLRRDIFHEGAKRDVKRLLPLLEQCILQILDELKADLKDLQSSK
jgi:hypothetical protein